MTVLTNGLAPGSNEYDFVTDSFTPAVSGTYIFGQTSAPEDTAMIVYEGSFDPGNPGANIIAFNDDYDTQADSSDILVGVPPGDIEFVNCSDADSPILPDRCPAVRLSLTQGVQYHIIISTYDPDDSLSFPMDFFVYGPGGVQVASNAGAVALPTLSTWSMILLAGLLSLAGLMTLRRRER